MSLENIKDTDIAYLAGFVDGEGCFFIGKFKTISSATGNVGENFHTLLKLSNTDYETLYNLNKKFGGLLQTQSRLTRKSKIDREVYSLTFSGDLLTDITEKLLPYLITKRKQAEIMIKMRSTFFRGRSRGQTPVDPNITNRRNELMIELRKHNSRFHSHPLKQE